MIRLFRVCGLCAPLLAWIAVAPAPARGSTDAPCEIPCQAPLAECGLGGCEPPEFWVIDTRSAPRCGNVENGFRCLSYKRFDAARGVFVRENLESFVAGADFAPTLVHIHGNGNTEEEALEASWRVYHRLYACAGPKRLVCWSWPSDRVKLAIRPRESLKRDFQLKFAYAERQGYYLARIVQRLTLSQRIALEGHSFGAGVSASALHYLGGGQLNGMVLEGGFPATHPNLRAAMVAGAFDYDFMLPGHRYGQALTAAECVYITYNRDDRMLQYWPRFSERGQDAIGYTGMPLPYDELRYKVIQRHVSDDVGRQHRFTAHLYSDAILSEICGLAFGG